MKSGSTTVLTDGRAQAGSRLCRIAFGSPAAMMTAAAADGIESGAARLDPELAAGSLAPANAKLVAFGEVRSALVDKEEALDLREPRVRQATAIDTAAPAVKRMGHRQRDVQELARRAETTVSQAADLRRDVDESRGTYGSLSLIERGQLVSRPRMEIVALLVAVADAMTLRGPMRSAGLGSGPLSLVCCAVVAGLIWATVASLGTVGGAYLRDAPEYRRRLLAGGFVCVLVCLVTGFVLVGLARHAWTAQQNAALVRAAAGQVGVPTLLDPVFLTAFALAGAGAAIIAISLCVAGQPGREARTDIVKSETALAQNEAEATRISADLASAAANLETADVAINEARADDLAARVEQEVIADRAAAERRAEAALTNAAIAEQDRSYWTEDKRMANGGCWVAAQPESRRVLARPKAYAVTGDGPTAPARAADPRAARNDTNN